MAELRGKWQGWGASFRKSITGEETGRERAYTREKKEAAGEGAPDACAGAYQVT